MPLRSVGKRAIALAFSFFILLSSFVVAAPAMAAEGDAESIAVTDGALNWGVRESYRKYVVGNASGRVTLSDGLTENEDGTYRWTVSEGTFAPATGALDVRFDGEANFWGHEGLMDLTIWDLHLLADAYGSAVLYADFRVDDGTTVRTGEHVEFAEISAALGGTVTPEEGRLRWEDVYASLGHGGVVPFLDHYTYGNPVDPISLDLTGDWPSGTVPETWDQPGQLATAIDDIALPDSGGAGWSSGVLSDAARGVVFLISSGGVLHVYDDETRELLSVVEGVNFLLDVNEDTGEVLVKGTGTEYRLIAPDGSGGYAPSRSIQGLFALTTGAIDDSTGAIVIGSATRKYVYQPDADGEYALTGEYLVRSSGIPLFFDSKTSVLYAQQGSAFLRYRIVDGELVLLDQVTLGGSLAASIIPDFENDRIFAVVDGAVHVYGSVRATSGALNVISSVTADDGLVGAGLRYDPSAQTLLTTGGATLQLYALSESGEIGDRLLNTSWDTTGAGAIRGYAVPADRAIWYVYASGIKAVSYGEAPSFTLSPADQTVAIPAGLEQTDVTLASAAAGEGVTLQWQQKTPGSIAFADIDGATAAELTVHAVSASSGTQYRVVAKNDFGTIVSDTATLTVQVAPSIVTHPQSASVVHGGVVEFTATADGNPAPVQDWELNTGSGWQRVVYSDTVSVFGDTLTISGVADTLNGAQYRAVFTSAAGTAYSDAASLTVTAKPGGPQETTTYTGVAFEWTGSAEWQAQPPNGSAAHYFSAGVSDGTQATYSATAEGVEIIQRTARGDSAATYAIRGAHVNTEGASQVIRLTNGTATVEPDGSAIIEWPATFSVNFYDGLVPSTMSNLVLTVDAEGAGTLVADLSGYKGDIANANAPKEPVEPAAGVTVAVVKNVTVDTANGFTVRPEFRGVAISAPDGEAAQNTTTSGWGAWPQEFVAFHGTTGLAAYFYTTGGSLDSKKAPSAFAIGFDGATPEVPEEPTNPGEENGGGENPALPIPTDAGGVEGSLRWGVKESFRSYITGSIAKGAISVSDGASAQDGAFWFGQSATDWTAEAGTGTTAYRGALRFTGHSGILDLTLRSPQVRIDSPSAGTLIVTVNGSQIELGALALSAATRSEVDGGVSYSNVPVSLTSAGARVFSYGSSQFYGAGTAMSPLSFVVGKQASPGGDTNRTVAAHQKTDWTPPAEPPARTGLYIDPEALENIAPGTEITVTGDGYTPNESDIKVVLYSDPVTLEENLVADGSGRATWTGIIPLDTELGGHTLTFQASSQDLGLEIEVREATALLACTVADATLDWGFKESFRSYISGGIANGDWILSDGATYDDAEFAWADGSGGFDAETFTGQVSFAGTVRFTGHDGLLNTSVANPTLLFTGRDTAYLLLDVTGVTMEDALAGNVDEPVTSAQVSFVELDLSAGSIEVSEDGSEITASEIPAAITSQGYESFPNYEAGTAFDPVSFSIRVETDCADPVVPEDDQSDAGVAAEPQEDAADFTWLAVTGGGIGLAGLIAAVAIWLVRRGRSEAPMS